MKTLADIAVLVVAALPVVMMLLVGYFVFHEDRKEPL